MYLLDTDVVGLMLKGRLPRWARDRLRATPRERVGITAITLGELVAGAARSSAPREWLAVIDDAKDGLACLPFDADAAQRFGELSAHLERHQLTIPEADLRVAAICVAADRILISGNSRSYEKIPGLRFENWLRAERAPSRA